MNGAVNAHGGTGQPVARGAHLAGVFSWACEDDYLCGRRPRLRRWRLWAGLIFTAIFAGFIVFMWQTVAADGDLDWLLLGLGALCVLPVLGKTLVDHHRRRTLERAELYLGHILSCTGKKVLRRATGNSPTTVFEVKVAWRLRLPDGLVLEQESTFDRDDLDRGERPMPTPGAPIAVLVRSPTEFMVL